jgi:hypothetical protein
MGFVDVAGALVALSFSLSVAGCGGAPAMAPKSPGEAPAGSPSYGAPPAGYPGYPAQPANAAEPSGAQGTAQPSPAPPPASPQATPSTAPPPDAASVRSAARADFARAQADLEAASTDCATACRALASMERAATHLCELAGDPDDQTRCNDARRKVIAARERVRSACGTCQ